MKEVNLIIIATIIGTLVISVFIFQPSTIEARHNAMPSATPRKVRKVVRKPEIKGVQWEVANAAKGRKALTKRTGSWRAGQDIVGERRRKPGKSIRPATKTWTADHPLEDDVAYRKKPGGRSSKVKKVIKRKRTNH